LPFFDLILAYFSVLDIGNALWHDCKSGLGLWQTGGVVHLDNLAFFIVNEGKFDRKK
jgi:hypothetical protein